MRKHNAPVFRGGDFNDWDLEVRGGLFGSIRTLMAIEEHGSGKQLIRFRAWSRCSPAGLGFALLFALLSWWAALDQAWVAFGLLSGLAAALVFRMLSECAYATAALLNSLKQE